MMTPKDAKTAQGYELQWVYMAFRRLTHIGNQRRWTFCVYEGITSVASCHCKGVAGVNEGDLDGQ